MDAEMQYFKMSSMGVFAQTCNIYWDVVIEYNRHRDAVFCDIITGCCAQKNSIYCDAAYGYTGQRNAVF